ncbi:fluoride efflux transporter CrcB [Paenibacillus ginsengarvi]|uniref:Fluoride-specific ion channel FluC n=1 Tax=Paenibacillus ginsengarvi TaxID=400777 RepID=A0A3B0CMW6_9BACL|nr:fluoride efflux transporter CrcB [Paenibacillus ginsengarvi]RKN87015.1 fluoride efflux transporter CrcB [Paenibacillus ginsengarvi]
MYIGIAGAAGALSRYGVGVLTDSFAPASVVPLATLLCNYTGSFILGWVTGGGAARLRLPDKGKIALTSGFVGSYTTFSTFSMETVRMTEDGRYGQALLYVLVSLWGGLLLAWLGVKSGERLLRRGERS